MDSHARRKTGFERRAEQEEAKLRAQYAKPPEPAPEPRAEILDMSGIEQEKVVQPKYVIEGLVTTPGAWLIVGAMKAGKTVLAVQMALDYHAGNTFLQSYRMLESRAALVIEQDDPAGLASIQDIIRVYPGIRHPESFFAVKKPDFVLGEGFIEQMLERGAVVDV